VRESLFKILRGGGSNTNTGGGLRNVTLWLKKPPSRNEKLGKGKATGEKQACGRQTKRRRENVTQSRRRRRGAEESSQQPEKGKEIKKEEGGRKKRAGGSARKGRRHYFSDEQTGG